MDSFSFIKLVTDATNLINVVVALFCGGALGFVAFRIYRRGVIRRAEAEAAEFIQQAKDEAEILDLDEKEKTQELEMQMWTNVEKDLLRTEDKIEELTELAEVRRQKSQSQIDILKNKSKLAEAEVLKKEKILQDLETEYRKKQTSLKELNETFIDKICTQLKTTREETLQLLEAIWIEEVQKRSMQLAQRQEEETKEHAEQKAKEILSKVIERFERPYCPERGIPGVYFENENQRKHLSDPEGANIRTLSELTGCDIYVEPDMELIGVAGFDPVRRELTRRSLERLLKEKKAITPEVVKKVVENQKRELLGQIKRDGDNLAKELRLEHLHPEVRQVMGSLRFRYSFTQNQYFHCGEVGWLCGLLASELGGVPIKKARRSGMLHDLGKAMDHELEGGHAVIGADFISKRNEAPDIIHAVRAHHYDEQPSTDMAFLVIAADAISGARPGARRSTMESYNQKVTELERIAKSHRGVIDCFVLSGGRECRVLVNGREVNDMQSLQLSQKIARQIEEECNYPGQIKVVVVRETYVAESTKVNH